MTKVYLEQDGNRFTVSAKDHATGSVECCAAVSCLLFALAGFLQEIPFTILRLSLEDADAQIVFRGDDRCKAAFDLVKTAFVMMEQSYGEFVSVDFVKIE